MKVLVVDDEDVVRRSLVRVCGRRDHAVFEASNGEEALEVWKEIQPDLVYLDVLMPGLSGPEVLKEVGERVHTKVVLMSAYAGEYDDMTVKSLGADLFIQKPFEDIFSVVEKGESLCDEL